MAKADLTAQRLRKFFHYDPAGDANPGVQPGLYEIPPMPRSTKVLWRIWREPDTIDPMEATKTPKHPILVHKIRLMPTKAQEDYLRKACGVARFAYNWALAAWKLQYEIHQIDPDMPAPNDMQLAKELNSVKQELFPWMDLSSSDF